MPEPDLFGALAPPFPRTRYFALRPERDAAWEIESLARYAKRRHDLAGRIYPSDRLHLSLCPVGSRKGDLEAALEAAGRIRAVSFPIVLDTVSTFGGGSNTCLVLRCSQPVEPLGDLWKQLRSELVGIPVVGRPRLVPHLTLVRPAPRVSEFQLEQPIGWVVSDFVLALKGKGRAWDLARWTLG